MSQVRTKILLNTLGGPLQPVFVLFFNQLLVQKNKFEYAYLRYNFHIK